MLEGLRAETGGMLRHGRQPDYLDQVLSATTPINTGTQDRSPATKKLAPTFSYRSQRKVHYTHGMQGQFLVRVCLKLTILISAAPKEQKSAAHVCKCVSRPDIKDKKRKYRGCYIHSLEKTRSVNIGAVTSQYLNKSCNQPGNITSNDIAVAVHSAGHSITQCRALALVLAQTRAHLGAGQSPRTSGCSQDNDCDENK